MYVTTLAACIFSYRAICNTFVPHNSVRLPGKKNFSFTIENVLVGVAKEYFVTNTGDPSIISA
jgi:hypothetical protein